MKLIKLTDEHYVIVDNSEIKEGDYHFDFDKNEIHTWKGNLQSNRLKCKKVTHSTQPLYKNDFWAIQELKLSEVKELIGEVDVEKKAEYDWMLHTEGSIVVTGKNDWKSGFHHGYNQAIEDNKDTIDKILDFLILKMESISQDMINKDSLHLGRFRAYKQIYETIKPKTEWDVEFDSQGKLKLI